eukprot:4017883-Amphidinium_carterae.1
MLLQQVLSLCSQAAEVALVEEREAHRQIDALQEQLEKTKEAKKASEAALEAELHAVRQDNVDLIEQLDSARAAEVASSTTEVLQLKERVQQLRE